MHADGYFALVLSLESSDRLKAAYATLASPLAHHVTVKYGTRDPSHLPSAFQPSDLGKTFRLVVIGAATRADGGVQAVAVALLLADGRALREGFSENRIAHVTIATDGATEAVAANALLEAGFDAIDGPELEATLLHSDAWHT